MALEVMYHKALEKVASIQNIKFDQPNIIEHDVPIVTGHWKDKTEWTIGEAMPINIDRQQQTAVPIRHE